MRHPNAYPLDATAVLADEWDDHRHNDDDEPEGYTDFLAEQERHLAAQRRRPVRRMRSHW